MVDCLPVFSIDTLTVTGGKGAIMAQNPFGALRGTLLIYGLTYRLRNSFLIFKGWLFFLF